jgi:hypothetical protein
MRNIPVKNKSIAPNMSLIHCKGSLFNTEFFVLQATKPKQQSTGKRKVVEKLCSSFMATLRLELR